MKMVKVITFFVFIFIMSINLAISTSCEKQDDNGSSSGNGQNKKDSGVAIDQGIDECQNISWRSATEKSVACPHTNNCLCSAPQICCVEINSTSPTQWTANCQELTSCKNAAFECDGPEDCDKGLICCMTMSTASSSGSQCKKQEECAVANHAYIACRSDEDCVDRSGFKCIAAEKGSYFESVAAICK